VDARLDRLVARMEGELSLPPREHPEERLLPGDRPHARVDHAALDQRHLRPLLAAGDVQPPGLAVHRQDLQQVHERDLRQVALQLPAAARNRPGGLHLAEDLVDAGQHLLPLEGLAQVGPESGPLAVDRLPGDHHRDALGARVGPQNAEEGAGVEERRRLVEEHQVRQAQDGDLQRPGPVARAWTW